MYVFFLRKFICFLYTEIFKRPRMTILGLSPITASENNLFSFFTFVLSQQYLPDKLYYHKNFGNEDNKYSISFLPISHFGNENYHLQKLQQTRCVKTKSFSAVINVFKCVIIVSSKTSCTARRDQQLKSKALAGAKATFLVGFKLP